MATGLQRAVDAGELILPDARPAWLGARDWALLVRHVRDRAPFAALGREHQMTPRRMMRDTGEQSPWQEVTMPG